MQFKIGKMVETPKTATPLESDKLRRRRYEQELLFYIIGPVQNLLPQGVRYISRSSWILRQRVNTALLPREFLLTKLKTMTILSNWKTTRER